MNSLAKKAMRVRRGMYVVLSGAILMTGLFSIVGNNSGGEWSAQQGGVAHADTPESQSTATGAPEEAITIMNVYGYITDYYGGGDGGGDCGGDDGGGDCGL